MKAIFLKAKHWQLFILGFGLPMLVQLLGMVQFFSVIQKFEIVQQTGDVSILDVMDSMLTFFGFLIFVVALMSAILIGWLWSVGIGLQEKIPEGLAMETGLFKAAIILPTVYSIGLFAFAWFIFLDLESLIDGTINPNLFTFIFPIHALAMVAMVYSLYFVAKTIKTAEVQGSVSFGDFIGEFFMVWFFPIGVWIVQPKINEIYLHEEENHDIEF